MNTLSLNIGLAVGNVTVATETLEPLAVLTAITQHLPATEVKEWHVRVHPITGELTLAVRLRTAIAGPNTLAPCIHDLCLALRQDCISGKLAIRGEKIHEFLTGPKAADYGGAFDPTYWLPVTCKEIPPVPCYTVTVTRSDVPSVCTFEFPTAKLAAQAGLLAARMLADEPNTHTLHDYMTGRRVSMCGWSNRDRTAHVEVRRSMINR